METSSKHNTILKVSIVSATTNTLLALFKIIIGKLGHSQALIADGIHSFSDLVSDALVYIAARASGKDPDSTHPYGHQRIETVATIVIALILLGIGASICYDAIVRIAHHVFPPTASIPVIIVAASSILANEWLFRYSLKHGKKINSSLLISNAWHNRSDAFVSVIVLLSVIGSISGLPWLDAVGAIIIALLIIKMGGEMIFHAANELIDRGVDSETLTEIEKVITRVPGVKSLHQLRTRLHGGNIFVDCHIIVDPFISVSEGHHVGERVHLTLLNEVKNLTDVTVHIDPEDDETSRPSLDLPHREQLKKLFHEHCAKLPGYNNISKIMLHYLAGKLMIEIVMTAALEINQEKSLEKKYKDALQQVTKIKDVKIYFSHE